MTTSPRSPRFLLALCALTALSGAGALLTSVPVLAQAGAPVAQNTGSPLAQARAKMKRGDYRGALEQTRALLRSQPKNRDARLVQSEIYLRMGNGIAAQTEVEQARKAGASIDSTRHLFAEAMAFQQRYDDALAEAADAKIPPAYKAQGARVRALALMGKKEMEAASVELLNAERLAPRDEQIKLDLARFYAAQQKFPEAQASIDQGLAINPTHVRSLVFKGGLVRNQQGLSKALPYFDQALKLDANNLEALVERAATLVDLRKDQQALADLRKLYQLTPENPFALYLDAVLKSRARKFDEAAALMTRTKGALNTYPPALLLQGVIAYETSNLQQAREHLGNLLRAQPNSGIARRLYGATLMRLGDADGAIAQIKPMIDKGQGDARLLSLLGSAYARKGDYDQAQHYLEQAVTAEPTMGALRTQLAMARVAEGDNVGATRDLRAVLDDDPNSMQALLMVTLIDLRSGNFKVAQTSALKLVKTYPQLPIGYNMLGAAYLGQNDFKNAEIHFRLALEKKPDYHEARRNLAQLLAAQRKFNEARRELQRVLDTDRANVKTMMALANVSQQQGRSDERIEWLNKAVAANSQILPPRMGLVQAYLQMGDRSKALAEAMSLDRDFPNNPAVIELLGNAQAQMKRFNEASATFGRLATLVPNKLAPRLLQGRALMADKQVEEARKIYLRALSLPKQNLAPALIDLMALEAQEGDFDKAVAYANQLRKEYPKAAVADFTLANLFMGAGRYQEAIRYYEAARATKFSKIVALNLSSAYQRTKQTDKAVGVLSQWLQLNPKDISARMAIGDIYLRSGQNAAALAQYEMIAKAAPNNAAVLNNLAWLYQRLGKPQALTMAQKAYKISPNTPEIADTYGWVLVQQGKDKERGLLLIQQALQKRPKSPDIRLHFAEALHANGRSREAIRELDTLMRTHPTYERLTDARQLMMKIKRAG